MVGLARCESLNPLGELNRKPITSVVVPENVPIQRFECSEEARQRIQAATGAAVLLQGQIRARVRLQARNAAGLAKKAAKSLETVDPNLFLSFKDAFSVEPNSPPSWARPGGWTHARIVRQRFLGAHKHLTSTSLLYSCWGKPRGAGGPEVNPDYLALALPGKYWIALGRRFWQADQSKDFDTTTYALLLAALRAYYGPLLSDSPLVRKIGNLHCYVQFVADLFNANLPDWVGSNCPKSA
jgi:hypothetical protein